MMEDDTKYKAEIDWKDLLKKPAKLFGYSYFYFIVLIGIIGYLYISHLTNIGMNSVTPTVLIDSTALVQDIPLQSPRVIPPVDVMKVGISSPELVAKGKDLFQKNCTSCHGENGTGDGPTAPTLNPKPRNFHSLEGWKNGSKVSQMYKTLQEGIAGSAMASYNYMSPEERFALIHYVREFATGQPQDTPNELKRLDTLYQLSAGINVPGQIPVTTAMRLIENESVPKIDQIKRIEKNIFASDDEGATIYKRFVIDKNRMLASLIFGTKNISNTDELIKIVSMDPPSYGLKPAIVNLSATEWSSFFQFITSQIKETR